MTIEGFYETLKSAVELDVQLRLQASLEAIQDTLNNLVSSPAHPQQQSTLATALKTFTAAAKELGHALTPSEISSIAQAGGAEFFDPSIADKVKTAVATNAMTPSVARDFVHDLATRRAIYLATMKQTLSGMDNLGISGHQPASGVPNVAFVIPPDMFDNQLASFAKELGFINNLIQHFSEALTGEPEPVTLEALSSSLPTVTVAASPKVAEGLATAVSKFLDAWERAEKIRRIRQELIEVGLKKQTFEDLTDQITTTVGDVIEESIQTTLSAYNHDPARRQQLENALRQDTRRLFGQIERGLNIQFRASPVAGAADADRLALETVDRLSREMQFPKAAAEPMLLTRAQVLEGDFDSVSVPKKTPAPQPAIPAAQPAPLAASGGSLWSRRRSDKQE